MRTCTPLATIFLALALAALPARAGEMTAGVARTDLTPPMEMGASLGGYGERMSRPAEGVHDRVFAKALVLADGDRRFALVTADILGFPPTFKHALVERLAGSGWSAEQIMLLPSHSHTSIEMNAIHPKNILGNKQLGVFDPKLFEWTLQHLAAVVEEAASDLVPVTLGTSAKALEGWNRNRRKRGGVTDRALVVTRIDTADGKPLAALVQFTAHPTFMGAEHMLFSGGWPGHLQRTLETQIGSGVTVLYYNGAQGDQSPVGRSGSGSDRWETASQYGRALAVEARDLWSSIRPQRDILFDFNLQSIELPKHRWHPDFMRTGGKEYGLSKMLLEKLLPILFPAQTTSGSLRLGDLVLVGIPGEMQAKLGMELKARIQEITSARYAAIGGLANEWISYILSADQYQLGGYEASVSFYGPDLGQAIVAGAVAGVKELRAKRPDEQGGLEATYLRTEYRLNPLGLGVLQPRLSWILQAPGQAEIERGEKQTAYRILVASDAQKLAANQGDLWDSGKVESDETAAIPYAGGRLASRLACHWKVKVWNKDGRSSGWSEPALWTMGLLEESDWVAEWIGYDRPALQHHPAEQPSPLKKASWIWHAEGSKGLQAEPGTCYFRRPFQLPEDRTVVEARLILSGDNSYTANVNGTKIGGGTDFSRAKRFDIADQLTPGANVIAVEATNAGDNANPAGIIASLQVRFAQGDPLVIQTDRSWVSANQAADQWQSLDFDNTAWAPVEIVTTYGQPPWNQLTIEQLRLPPPRILRRQFSTDRSISRATLYSSALGIYQMHLNGRQVADDYFSPGWTDYNKRIYYQTYDVTNLVQEGENTLGAILADGWYAGYLGFGGQRDHYGDRIRLLAQLEIEYADGTRATVATDPDWRANTGPLVEADFLMGEHYDARLEIPGWDQNGLDDSGWHPVDVSAQVAALLEPHPGVPVRALEPIEPVSISEPAPGCQIVDLGQNFAGMIRLKVRGERGRQVRIRHVERLNPDGTAYTDNLRSARAIDTYICRGDEQGRWWQPRFTFHGFQYVEVTGFPDKLSVDDLVGIPVSSDTPIVGHLECSDPMVNQLMSNIYWTQRMNHIDIPTDCPQRDERLGWTGDAQVYVRTATLLTDIQAFYTKWLIDLDDAQREDGQYPMVAPLKSKGVSADGGPAWADAGVICPWNIYEVYGDRRLLAQHYERMARFIQFCQDRSTDGLLPPEKFHCFGDWLSIKDDTPKDVIYLAYFANSTKLMARAARALGNKEDMAKYDKLYGQIKAAFQQAYVTDAGRIKGDTQSAYVLALRYGLVDGQQKKRAADRLVELIEGRDWHLSTGFIGTKDLMLVLSQIGRNDVAYRLLHNTTFPSWGFSIVNGATTIWERWNGWTPESGFFDPGMNSFAHYSFGAVAQWMFETIGGIQTGQPGYRTILIRPRPGGKLTWAKVRYDSIRGPISTQWKMDDEKFTLDVTIPAGVTAEVHVPTSDPTRVTESLAPAESAVGVRLVRNEPGIAVYEVASGNYAFAAPRP
jgi:alpha-L-rhamnosidase